VRIKRDRYENLSNSDLVSFLALSITTDADTTGQFDWKEIKGKLSDNQLDIVSFFTCDELIVHGGI
jgi:hypothetical protein